MRIRRLIPLAVLGAAAWSIAAHPWGWAFGIGIHPYPGPQTPWTYQLYSGFLPALTVATLLGSAASLYHLHNCHQDHCWRIGKHKVDGTPWCGKHHQNAREQAAATLADVVAKLDIIAGELKRWRSPSGLSWRNRA